MDENVSPRDTSSTYRIEPLKGSENYTTWHIKMIDILMALELWGYVSGTIPRPHVVANPPEQEPQQGLEEEGDDEIVMERSPITRGPSIARPLVRASVRHMKC